jgi:Zn-dependent M28 family amino/carboxypeptidase
MKILIATFLLFIGYGSSAQEFRQHILLLTSDAMQGRPPATVYEQMAANYIRQELLAANCGNVVFQEFPFENKSAVNVVGIMDFGQDSTIVIAAHYDHLGTGFNKSLEIVHKHGFHPGADDNASGVAMLVELAKAIGKVKTWTYNFAFIAYSAHEAGLFGSTYFSGSEMCKGLNVRAVINMDMVGRMDTANPVVRVSGAKTDVLFDNFFKTLENMPFRIRHDDSNITGSDLAPFYKMGIPVLNYTTGIHTDYHKTTDTEDKINYQGMGFIYQLILSSFDLFKFENDCHYMNRDQR